MIPQGMEFRCPICDGEIVSELTYEELEGCTADCVLCDGLLMFRNHHALDMHKWLHYESEGKWSIDGSNVGVIEVDDEG